MQTTSKHKEHVIIHSDNWVQMQWEKNSRERRAIVSTFHIDFFTCVSRAFKLQNY